MTANWQKIEEAVAISNEMPRAVFAEWLTDFCRDDKELKSEIESLLAFQDDSKNFLEKTVGEYAARILPEAEDDFTGKIFGNYRILREIGRGGMGAVFLAERIDGEFNQQAALKIVRQSFVDRELLQHFRRERQILANLSHPNIARLLDGGVSALGEPFLVMEFIEGETLLKFANDLGLKSKLKIFLKICRAVAFAHRNLIVHRDLKPSNILVTKDGEPKLLDFGLAKVLSESLAEENQTQTNFRALTPAYASPEQIKGETVTTASDIYSLGKIFAELVGEENVELRNIAAMAMRDEPERRYPSVETFAADIENYLDGKPLRARPATFRYRAMKFTRRNKTAVAAGFLIALAVLTGLIVSLWQAANARRQRDSATAQRQKAERVNQFLSAALAYSDPSAAAAGTNNRRDATINEMLDEFAPRIETELADQPDVQAFLQRTVGFAYFSRARLTESEKYLNAALEKQHAIYGENHPETAHTLFGLANIREAKGDFTASAEILRRVIEIYRNEPPADSFHRKVFINSLITLGNNFWSLGEYAAADPLYDEALKLAFALEGRDRELAADAKTGLGINRYAFGKLDEATLLIREAIAEYHNLPHTRYKLPIALNHLGQVLLWKGDYDESLAFLRESEKVSFEIWGEADYSLARSHWLQVYTLCFKGDCAAAEKNLEKSEELANRYLPTNKIIRANNADARNIFLTRTGRLPEGEKFGRLAVELYQNSMNSGSNSVTLARMNLADNLILQKKYAEAETILREAFQDSSEAQGAEHWRTKQVAQKLLALEENLKQAKSAQK